MIGHDLFGLHPSFLFLRGQTTFARVLHRVHQTTAVSLACSPAAKTLACDVSCQTTDGLRSVNSILVSLCLWLKRRCFHPTTNFPATARNPSSRYHLRDATIVHLSYFGHAELLRSASCCALCLVNQSAILELEERYHHPTLTLIGIRRVRQFLPPWIQRPNLSRCPAVF